MATRVLSSALFSIAVGLLPTQPTAATVVSPITSTKPAGAALNHLQPVRRVCQVEFVCPRGPMSCHWADNCRVTSDYPRRKATRGPVTQRLLNDTPISAEPPQQ